MKFDQPIAIVGLGGIFPNAPTPQELWRLVAAGKSAAKDVPEGRWPLPAEAVYDPNPAVADKVRSRRGCFISGFELDRDGLNLDAAFLDVLDPMFHLGLHAGRQAVLDARLDGVDRNRVGVVIGNIALPSERSSRMAADLLGRTFEEKLLGVRAGDDHRVARSASSKIAAVNRYVAGLPAGVIAKALGLGGGVYTLDAACASSLYAVKLACDELLTGRADAMLTGGLSRPDCFYTQMGFSQLRAVSPSGVCAPFDGRGDGLVVGEGAGMFVLKRLVDACRDGDVIHAVIRGAGLSNDIEGNLLAPSSEGQARAMRRAYEEAGWRPQDVDLIECHATGTPVGDAVEYASLRALWGKGGWKPGQCVIGSVKSNVGHLLTGAGAAGLMKAVFAIKNKTLPPTANFVSAGSKIDIDQGPFTVLKEARSWDARDGARDGAPRRAAVSGFGFGGINGHILIEEWVSSESIVSAAKAPVRRLCEKVAAPAALSERQKAEPIAVVGMGARVGSWKNLRAYQERVLGGGVDHPTRAPRWWGAQESPWFRARGLTPETFYGHYIDSLEAAPGKFRIPPKELADMLPQQLLMLETADEAVKDAGWDKNVERRDVGAFIGIGLDLNTTNFHFRWTIEKKAPGWAKALGKEMSDEELKAWTASLRDAAMPPLNADRTMGALGGIVASRVAREFRLGGSSFTVQSEESSGMQALSAAVRALQNRDLNAAVVGAVDLAGDIRSAIGAHSGRPFSSKGTARPFDREGDGAICADGAAAVVLKRLDDAIRDGDRIYSVIRGVGAANEGGADGIIPEKRAYVEAARRAWSEAGEAASPDYVEAHGSAVTQEDRVEAEALSELYASSKTVLGSAKSDVGHAGAASGLLSFVKASLCLYHEILPPLRGHRRAISQLPKNFLCREEARYWMRDRAAGARRAAVASMSVDGNCAHVVLEACERLKSRRDAERVQPLGARREAVFSVDAAQAQGLLEGLGALKAFARKNEGESIERAARRWFDAHPDAGGTLACAVVARSTEELLRLAAEAEKAIKEKPGESLSGGRVFYAAKPVGPGGKIAYLFPGSGNQFPGMGRELSVEWPEALRRQDEENEFLKSQYRPDIFWDDANGKHRDAKACIFGQVALGTFVSDLMTSFGIKPDAGIGYSLGESAALFSLRAWRDRDEMLDRMNKSSLFISDLCGPCDAARKTWKLPNGVPVDWTIGVLDVAAEQARKALKSRPKAYLLIVNTPEECVVGGDRTDVEAAVRELGGRYLELDGVTTVHCEVAQTVKDAYRALHVFKTSSPPGVRFYSGCWGTDYELSSSKAADSVTEQALYGVDYPKVIEAAYRNGIRVFLEMGPGASCSRMVGKILKGRPHLAASACSIEEPGASGVLKTIARLIADRVPLNMKRLYGGDSPAFPEEKAPAPGVVRLDVGGAPFNIPAFPVPRPAKVAAPALAAAVTPVSSPAAPRPMPATAAGVSSAFLTRMKATEDAKARAHAAFLRISAGVAATMAQTISYHKGSAPLISTPVPAPFMDRAACMTFAVGKIADVLGLEFAPIDRYPTRVRLPDEPLMLVDRVLSVEGEPRSMTSGRVVTEHDVTEGKWYLDGGRIPTCIAVEAGQADLFLSGYLGIDFIAKGKATYRLLDAVVTFHGELPRPGKVIHYDIRIERFFRQGETYLFKFSFDGTVDGRPLITMREGCAGFFTEEELAAGKGIVHTKLDLAPQPGTRPADWEDFAPLSKESFDEAKVKALRAGDLAGAFGGGFDGLSLNRPATIPGKTGRMRLFDRVVSLDPAGGRYGLGQIRSEADIHPDDWFLTCHFVDDKVMPGTLMYECCMHTLRFYLMRMGWVGEEGTVVCEPIAEIRSRLKCRGQVIPSTRTAAYEISIKELGYDAAGTPYAVADALMYADGKAIVEITDMSIRLSGLSRDRLRVLWAHRRATAVPAPERKPAVYDDASILAFAVGKPSEAFGEPYRVFDKERTIARLPGPPYKFLDRITDVEGEPWKLKAGPIAEAQYDVSAKEWYFASNRQPDMPFAVLLEAALQPCGWLAAYLGSALTSDIDLRFRNLGGSAVLHRPVGADIGMLTTRVKMTQVSHSAGMIIQHYSIDMTSKGKRVYTGKTYFGFFSKQALKDQVGIRDAAIYRATTAEEGRGVSFRVPEKAPFPDETFRMVDFIDLYVSDGGPKGLGFIRGIKDVNPDDWFFKAHFFQDPVWPGSLGLESFLQILKVFAAERWQAGAGARFENVVCGEAHEWVYRGQILPTDERVTVQAVVTEIDDVRRMLRADGHLTVDDRVIYEMKGFTLRLV